MKSDSLPGTGATFSRATHRKSPTFSFLMSKVTPFLCSSLTNSCLRAVFPLPSQQHLVSNELKHIQNRDKEFHIMHLPSGLYKVNTQHNVIVSREKICSSRFLWAVKLFWERSTTCMGYWDGSARHNSWDAEINKNLFLKIISTHSHCDQYLL